MGDRLPFVCCDAAIFVVEGDPDVVAACGGPMGASEMFAWVVKSLAWG